ncbi:hypothetical protein D3C85_921790 [compost metagenome]
MPAQMNMNTQVMVGYSGLPLPRRMLPYLLKARYSTARAQPNTKSCTAVPKVRVEISKRRLARASDSAGKAARPNTVRATAIRLAVIKNMSFLLLLDIDVSWNWIPRAPIRQGGHRTTLFVNHWFTLIHWLTACPKCVFKATPVGQFAGRLSPAKNAGRPSGTGGRMNLTTRRRWPCPHPGWMPCRPGPGSPALRRSPAR